MKLKHLFSSTLSLALVACQVAAPLNAPIAQQTGTHMAQTLNLPKPALPQIETQATVTQAGNTEKVNVQIKLPKGFRTQLANREQLAFIKVSLKGQGISGTLSHEGAEFLPVSGDTITANIDDVPLKNGDLRVVMVQGYDSNFQPLGAYEARGYYRSKTGVKTLTITLRRSMILLGRILEQALTSNAALLDVLDVDALQTVLEEAMGFNPVTGEFASDPSLFDAVDIYNMIPGSGNPLPTANDINGNARQTHQDVVLNIQTPNGGDTNEVVRLVINDPNSGAKLLPTRTASGTEVIFANVIVGTWTLSAYDSEGNLLNSTQLVISESGVTITDNPLVLTDVNEYSTEFRINTYTTGSQSSSTIAMDSDGDFVVAWTSNNQQGSKYSDDIYAQRYNSVGVAQGSEFRVNTYTSSQQITPAIAMDSDGDFVITWQSINQDGDAEGVYAQRYNSAGVAQGSEFRVNTYTSSQQITPAIAMDSDGDFVITWQNKNIDGSPEHGIYAQRYTSSGAAQGSEFKVNTYTTGGFSNPAVALDNDGDFVVTWESFRFADYTNNTDIYGQRYNSVGVMQGSEFPVNSHITQYQSRPAIAIDTDGDFVVTWQSQNQDGSSYGIYAQRYDSTGAAQDSEFLVNYSTSNSQSSSAIVIDTDGDFVITWQSDAQDGSSNGIYAQRYNSAGVAQGSEFRVNTYTINNQSAPAIAIDTDGDFVITWDSSSQDTNSSGVYGKRYNAAGEEQ